MKKLIALLFLLAVSLPLHAEIGSYQVWAGTVSNSIYRGPTQFWVFNRVLAGADITANTNRLFLITNAAPAIPSTSFILTSGGWVATAGGTNGIGLARSVDKVTWNVFTNVVVTFPQTNTARGSVEITTLGNYPYVQVCTFTNLSTAASTSNSIDFHWK
jgi:hypothetical protein